MNISHDPFILKEIESLKGRAIEKTGLKDFGDPFFEAPLAAWVKDINTQNISDFGEKILRAAIYRDLCRRLKVFATITEHPEILEVEIPPIIMIMGAPRTGTTLLHNLMADHPHGRPLLRWELMEPVPPPESATYATDPRISEVQAISELMRGTLYERMHWVNAHEPEENTWGLINCTGLFGRGIASLMIHWNRCLSDLDHRPVFRDFRKLIQLLIWKCPLPSGGHLVLKCPMTTAHIQAFADVFPEATFTLVHRDPFRVIVSSCTIAKGIYQPFIREEPGPLQVGGSRVQELFEWLKTIFRALETFAKAEPGRVSNIRYADLMNDAVLATRSVYDSCNMNAPEDLEKLILGFLEQQRSGQRISPPERYDTFGFDADSVWSDPIVSQYCQFFGLQREESRIADTKTGT